VSWQTFYLAAFLLGFVLVTVSVVAGAFHLPFGHGIHLPHAHGGGGHAAPAHAGGGRGGASPFNFATAMAFVAWFGGVGYLLCAHSTFASVAILGLAIASGIAGGGVVFAFLSKVLLRREAALDPADFAVIGVLGRVSAAIRDGGTGEITYSQGGTRRSIGARCDGEGRIDRGCEVVVTRYEKGLAYVRPWDEL
jgi:hypothetical protein